MKSKDRNRIFVTYGILVFAWMFVFLTKINPLVVYDTDDWMYIYELRKPIPLIHEWNPTKVFPETFMPIVSYLGAYIIKPIIGDYCFSLTLAHGLFGAVLITIYFVQFVLLLQKKKNITAATCVKYGFLFILLHFIALINSGSNNPFLLGSINLTCFYNYTLSVIINATLVMHFMSYGGVKTLFRDSTLLHKFIVVAWGYFALNSNLFSSVVLATYVGTELLLTLISDIKARNFKLIDYIKFNIINLFIIMSWFVVNFLETRGGRAGDVGQSFTANILYTLSQEVYGLVTANIFVTAFIIVVAVLWAKKCKNSGNAVVKFVLYVALSIVYLTLLSAVVDISYISRSDVMLGYMFYIYIALIACLNDLLTIDRKYIRTLFILLGTVILLFIMPGRLYLGYNFSNLSYSQCEALMNDIIDQFKTAEKEGAKELVLVLPKFDGVDNWPICDYGGDRFANALYRHHVIDSYIAVNEVIISESKNMELGINQ